ncbi:MAG: DUF4446 family protein [Acidaminococcales bacterium]|jgi:hypothetical protein|nr:DUF4446 family protein [Acidaminococcales bacterium]
MEALFGAAGISQPAAAVLAVVVAAALVAVAYQAFLLRRLSARYDALMRDVGGKSLEEMVLGRLEQVQKVQNDMALLNNRYWQMGEQLAKCVQKVSVVRFSAFDGTGSDLSFAIAFLDGKNDGVVFSSIYGRNEGRCYAKPVNQGQSTYALSDEEKRAIELCKKN